MGNYDLPAIIEFVLESTGHTQLAYIGHSMGTMMMFYAMAENLPYYKDKISVYVALAPVTSINDMSSPIVRFLDKIFGIVEGIFKLLNIQEVFPREWNVSEPYSTICLLSEKICDFIASKYAD